jgi:hypothetical protein
MVQGVQCCVQHKVCVCVVCRGVQWRECHEGQLARWVRAGMSNRGPPEGHKGHICVVMTATHDTPDIQYVFFVHNVFYTWK